MTGIHSRVKEDDVVFWRKVHQGHTKDTSENLM